LLLQEKANMTYSWTTLPNGQISVDGIVLVPSDSDAALFDTAVFQRWAPLASIVSAESGVDTAEILGFIAQESYPMGNPNSGSSAGAVGLMQVLPQFHLVGVSRDMWFDPLTNMRAGAKYLASLKAKGYDLPTRAAAYNSGHVTRNNSVWGMYAQGCPPTPGLATCYITRVVAFTNHAYDKFASTVSTSTVVGGVLFLAGGLAAVGYVAWKGGYYQKLRGRLRA
jgi:hypothetical protein